MKKVFDKKIISELFSKTGIPFRILDAFDRKIKRSFALKMLAAGVIFLAGYWLMIHEKSFNFWVLFSLFLMLIWWSHYFSKRKIAITATFFLLFLIVLFSINEMKKSMLEVVVCAVPEKFTQDTHIEKEVLESGIVGRINEVKDFARNNAEKIYLNDVYAIKDNNVESESINNKNVKSGDSNNQAEFFDAREEKSLDFSVPDSLESNDDINIKIQDIGISLTSFLRNLKRQNFGQDIFKYNFATVKAELIWKEMEKKWVLVFYYKGDKIYSRKEIDWNDRALLKFGELSLKYYSPKTILSYYDDNENNDELLRTCDEFADKKIKIDASYCYYYKGKVSYRRNKYQEALNFYDKAVDFNRENGRSKKSNDYLLVSRGWALYEMSLFDEALDSFKKALEKNPENVRALQGKAYVLEEMGRFGESIDELDKLVKLDKDNSWVFYMRGYTFSKLNKNDDAISEYDKAIEINPSYAAAYNNKGIIFEKKRELNRAVGLFGKAIEFSPSSAKYYENKKRALVALEREDEIKKLQEEAMKSISDPKNASEWINLGNMWESFDQNEKALEIYDKAIALYPKEGNLYNYKGAILHNSFEDRKEEALSAYNNAIEADPENKLHYANKGITLNSLREYSKALDAFDEALSISESYASAHRGRGIALDNLGRRDEAILAYDKAIEFAPVNVEYRASRGDLLQKMNDKKKALEDYTKSAEMDPGNAYRQYQIGDVLYELKSYQEAVSHFDMAIGINPKYSAAYNYKGLALEEQEQSGKAWEAINAFDKAIELDKSEVLYYRNKARVLDWLDLKDEARLVYEQALKIAPKGESDYYNRSIIFEEMKQYEKALVEIKKAIGIDKNDPNNYIEMGDILKELGSRRFEEAKNAYSKAIELDPRDEYAYASRCDVLNDMKKNKEALDDCNKAIKLSSDYQWAYSMRGFVYMGLNQNDEALNDFDRAISLDSNDFHSLYAKARIFAKQGRASEAIENLRKALAIDDIVREWARNNDEFDSIRQEEEFAKVLE